tara:strand:+ start:539 stop:2128 length:1590 start_codon:yes stop_codon:yes gene_type:complete
MIKMFKNRIHKPISFFIFAVIFLLFLTIDFRYKTDWTCCSDDFDYFSHSETLIIDWDFDYTNQLEGFEEKRFYNNGKSAPIGFFGTGLLSSPFLKIGQILDNSNVPSGNLFNYKILIYSFASIFALFFAHLYIVKSCNLLKIKINSNLLLLILFGTGLPHYAFERYSMTHAFDSFTVSLFIYFLIKFYSHNQKKDILFIFVFGFLSFIVRWTNYQIFLIPFVIKSLFFQDSKVKMRNYLSFYVSYLVFFGMFIYHSYLVWGIFTVNPSKIYQGHNYVADSLAKLNENLVVFIFENFKLLLNSLFTQEFGILWFSPIIFFGLLSSFYFLRKNILLSISIFLIYGFYFSIINAWGGTGNAFGLRFIYPTIPMSIFLFLYFYKFKLIKNYMKFYLISFSLFSLISVLFFESWSGTQLSLNYVENSYGNMQIYSQPYFLTGTLNALIITDSYLKIFVTSYLGVIIFKILFIIFNKNTVISFLTNIGLPTDNNDFVDYVEKVNSTDFVSVIIIIFIVYTIYRIYKNSHNIQIGQ